MCSGSVANGFLFHVALQTPKAEGVRVCRVAYLILTVLPMLISFIKKENLEPPGIILIVWAIGTITFKPKVTHRPF